MLRKLLGDFLNTPADDDLDKTVEPSSRYVEMSVANYPVLGRECTRGELINIPAETPETAEMENYRD